MIISHSNKFIFIKPRKVAGTTIELKLSPFLEAGDYATSIEPHEEHLRSVKPGVLVGKIRGKSKFRVLLSLRDHSTLKKAFLAMEQKIQNYFVITACRNPWDRAVSQFFWSYRKKNILQENFLYQKTEFNRFTQHYGPKNWINLFYGRKRQRRLNSSHLYTIKNQIIANYAIRFEHLEEDFDELKTILGFSKDQRFNNFNTKSTFRSKESRTWQKFYEKDTIELVRKCCADEIHCFNYNFEGNSKLTGPHLKAFAD